MVITCVTTLLRIALDLTYLAQTLTDIGFLQNLGLRAFTPLHNPGMVVVERYDALAFLTSKALNSNMYKEVLVQLGPQVKA